ncbi:MAG TPA: hypothetical protein VFK04_10075 [Gemmatimonadaceae bacterium]|jgi:hypothetical protein|nr:hypothetical protein [Gemmatimonadaceae bacterium]
MTAIPFVSTLRARRESVLLGPQDGETIDVRVEIPELWDVVRIVTPPSETVLAVKVAALAALDPRGDQRDYVMKLRGFEMLDEQQTLAESGAKQNSTFLLTHRRRRPVR